MLSPPIPCKGLRPLTHSRDFVGYVCIQLPRADFALIYNLLMSIGESLSTIFAIIGVQAQMCHDFPTDESVAAATDKVVPPAITRKLLLICPSPSAARPAVKNLYLLYSAFGRCTRQLILPSPNQNRPPCQRIQTAPQHQQHRLRL